MNRLFSSKKIFLFPIVGIVLLALFFFKDSLSQKVSPKEDQADSQSQNDKFTAGPIKIVSTKPNPLDEAIISPATPIEITFNEPIENIGEFKHRLEPETTKYQDKLSEDRKTVIITPEGSFPVGTTFTLFVSPLTKFDKGIKMDRDIVIHFKTIDYRGI